MVFKELSTWKNLLSELVLRNLKLRYSAASVGFFWALLAPLLLAGIYYFVFSVFLKISLDSVPYFLFLISGIFPWQFFQMSVVQSATSLYDNKHLIRESAFPHYMIPLSIVLSNACIFLPSLGLVILMAAVILKGLPVTFFFLPLAMLCLLLVTAAISVIVSILSLRFRDLPHFLEVSLIFLFYWTPIVYPMSLIPEPFPGGLRVFYSLNPFLGVISFFRITLLKNYEASIYREMPQEVLYALPVVFCVLMLWAAGTYYRRMKKVINDYLAY